MPPVLVLSHIARLPDTSLYHAFRLGGWEHFGWGQDRHLQADIFDAIVQNTEVHAREELPRWDRPKTKKPEARKPTVAELFAFIDGAAKTARHL